MLHFRRLIIQTSLEVWPMHSKKRLPVKTLGFWIVYGSWKSHQALDFIHNIGRDQRTFWKPNYSSFSFQKNFWPIMSHPKKSRFNFTVFREGQAVSLKINLPPTTSFERQEDVIFHSLFNRLHEAKLTKKKKVDHTKNIKDKTVPRTGIFFTLEKRSYIFRSLKQD